MLQGLSMVLELLQQTPLPVFVTFYPHCQADSRQTLLTRHTHVHQNNPKSCIVQHQLSLCTSWADILSPVSSYLVGGNIGVLLFVFAKIMLKGKVCLSFPHLSHTVKLFVPSSTELSDVELCHSTDTSWVFRLTQQVLLELCFTAVC